MHLGAWKAERSVLRLLLLTAAFCVQTAPALGDPLGEANDVRVCGRDASVPGAWSKSEVWAWQHICHDRTADFDALFQTQKGSGRQTDERFEDERRNLSGAFLRTVLTQEPYRSVVPPGGVRICGARFQGDVDLRDATLVSVLGIFDSKFFGKLILNRLRTPTSIAFPGSAFDGPLSMHSVDIGGDLNMTNGTFTEVLLQSANVVGGISMTDSRFSGALNMDRAMIGDSLFMRDAEFEEVVLKTARVGGQLSTRGSTFRGKLDMDNISTGGDILINDKSSFVDVGLQASRIGGQLSLAESTFRGQFNGQSMSVEQDLIMYSARMEQPMDLASAHVGGSIEVGGAVLSGLSLYGATIGKDLSFGLLGGQSTKWRAHTDGNGVRREPMVILWNASAGALVDVAGSWPNNVSLVLRDFRYKRLTPFDQPLGGSLGGLRDADWYIQWLAQDPLYSFQPYRQLATVLETYGESDKSHAILIAGRNRQLTLLDWSSPEKWSSWALRLVIGYGYGAGELRALAWALLFLLAGWIVARCKQDEGPESRDNRLGFWYSFDMLLPGIWLNRWHADVVLSGWWKYYFYIHRLVGFVLVSFVVAGLAGLTE